MSATTLTEEEGGTSPPTRGNLEKKEIQQLSGHRKSRRRHIYRREELRLRQKNPATTLAKKGGSDPLTTADLKQPREEREEKCEQLWGRQDAHRPAGVNRPTESPRDPRSTRFASDDLKST